jgi:hypothetical protein
LSGVSGISRRRSDSVLKKLSRDTRQPILLLRPFTADDPKDKFKIERGLTTVVEKVGLLIAAGHPNEHVPPSGATRMWLSTKNDYIWPFAPIGDA